MPKTATATAVSIDTLPERLRQFQRDLRVNALARWREWADTLADGGGCPEPSALLEVASILRIRRPADQLQADAAAIADVRVMTATAARCRKEAAALAAEFGGEQGIHQALAAAEAEVIRLRELHDRVASGCCADYHETNALHIRRDHRLVWPPAMPPIDDYLEEMIEL